MLSGFLENSLLTGGGSTTDNSIGSSTPNETFTNDITPNRSDESGKGCENSEFGCCIDGRTHAQGPNFKGCRKRSKFLYIVQALVFVLIVKNCVNFKVIDNAYGQDSLNVDFHLGDFLIRRFFKKFLKLGLQYWHPFTGVCFFLAWSAKVRMAVANFRN